MVLKRLFSEIRFLIVISFDHYKFHFITRLTTVSVAMCFVYETI